MLETLRIKNIAVIDSAEIPFKQGLNILSGETGAGKSIVLEAISLILGSRANIDLIRTECDEAVVEGLFNLSELPWMKSRLDELGFDSDTAITAQVAQLFAGQGYAFCVRYLSLGRGQRRKDLSAAEGEAILGAGLALMAVQHVRTAGWSPAEVTFISGALVCASF